jgi:integrase
MKTPRPTASTTPARKTRSTAAPLKAWQQAFESWRLHQRQIGKLRRVASEQVYAAMWQALAAWAIVQSPALRVAAVDAAALMRYIASRSGSAAPHDVLTTRYQARLLSLVQRVQAHLAQREQRPKAATALPPLRTPRHLRQALDDEDTAPDTPGHLSPTQTQALLKALQSPDAHGDQATRWQNLRNRCAVALQLGAGLGPGDVRALRLADVHLVSTAGTPQRAPVPQRLAIAANGSAPAHEAPLAPWAAQLLALWLAERQAQGLPGDWLFPSTRSGKPWGKVAQYNAALAVLADAGLELGQGGSFKLRHTFAMRQLRAGHSGDVVAQWLGVVDPSVMARYAQALGQIEVKATPPTTPQHRPVPV